MLSWLLQHTPLLYFTQSLWRDEAFSVLVAEKPISFFFGKLTFEPPFYYTLLHFWMKLVGESEIAVRSLSFVAFAMTIIIVIVWAEKLFKKHWLSWFLPVFFLFNPMLLYYAFEVRTYGWYIFFATLSMYGYLEKRWRIFVIASVLGFYTHSFLILLPAVAAIHFFLTRIKHASLRMRLLKNPMLQSLMMIGLLVSPWLLLIAKSSSKLGNAWYFPVDFQLVRSVLGNMFLGYEGTPGFLWPITAWLSLALFIIFIYALKLKEQRTKSLFFFLSVFFPLILVIGISFVKPIFVNRYLIFVSVSQIFLIAFAIEAIGNVWLQRLAAAGALIGVVGFSIWFSPFHKKVDIRKTFAEINAVETATDVVFAKTPLVLFESIYYSHNRDRVFLYNPNESPFPWYVGDVIITPALMATTIPTYPNRAFLVNDDGSFVVVYQANATHVVQKAVKKIKQK